MGGDPRLIGRFHRYAVAAGYASGLLGGAVLLGWLLELELLKSVATGLVTMKPNTAIGFIACGLALIGVARDTAAGRRLALAGITSAFLIGTLTLLQYVLSWDLGLDQLLFNDALSATQTSSPGRMSPATAICLLLSSVALGLYLPGTDAAARWAQRLALLVLLLGMVAVLGYLFDVSVLYRLGLYTSMAVHTALGFVLLNSAILALRIERGAFLIYATHGPGGTLLRRLSPAVILIPVLVAWMVVQGQQAGWYEVGFRPVLLTVGSIMLLFALVWSLANRLNTDDQRLQRSRQLLQSLFESAPDAILLLSAEGRIVQVNTEAERLFLCQRSALIGHPLTEFVPATVAYFVETDADVCAIGNQQQAAMVLSCLALKQDGEKLAVAVKLGEIQAEAGKAYLAVIRDMTDFKRAEAEIRDLNASLERRVNERTAELELLNQELESFSYSVSHDLRAPLRAIAGFSNALLEDCSDTLDAASQGHLRRVHAAAKRMDALIRDMLDLSRVTRANLDKQVVDLSIQAEEVAQELMESNPQRQVEWDIMPHMHVMADARLLRLLLDNLLGNALKFTRSQARAVIAVGMTDSETGRAYYVRDNGVGFDGDRVGELFAPFRRLHSEAEFEGTGIGLATVQRIIRRHGGRVWAESTPGHGATFYFTLA